MERKVLFTRFHNIYYHSLKQFHKEYVNNETQGSSVFIRGQTSSPNKIVTVNIFVEYAEQVL